MEIRELYGGEVAGLAQAGKEALGARFPSYVELRVLRDNPRVFLPVAVAGTEIVGIALAELSDVRGKRVGSVRLVASFVVEGAADRAVRLGLLSRLETKFKNLEADEIDVPGDQDPDIVTWLERSGYRLAAPCSSTDAGNERTPKRLVKQLRTAPPWTRPHTASPPGPGMVQ